MSASAHIVNPSKIQEELDKIWNQIDKTNKVRASLFNLIIYTKKNKRTDYVYAIVQKVIERFPSRVLFISQDHEEQIKTAVSVMNASSGEFVIACDLIEILCSEKNQGEVPFILLPHLVPDLPIYMLWADDPSVENPLFTQLQKYATRIIFDSETTNDLPRFAKTVLSLKCELADLNWARIEPIREVLAASCKHKEMLEVITHAKEIKISYNLQESDYFIHPKTPATYLQSWLSARLELDPKIITLETQKIEKLPPGIILSVDFSTTSNYDLAFQRNIESPNQISAIYSTPEHCNMPTNFIFPKQEFGQSLIKEIFHKGTSSHYLGVMRELGK